MCFAPVCVFKSVIKYVQKQLFLGVSTELLTRSRQLTKFAYQFYHCSSTFIALSTKHQDHTSTILVREVGEPPHIAKAYAVTER